jgi:hypothetical protein
LIINQKPMNFHTTNSELLNHYQSYYSDLQNRAQNFENNPSSPLLMHVFPEYFEAKNKLMIVGKETNSWADHVKNKIPLGDVIDYYKKFALGHGYFGTKGSTNPRSLNSPFWNVSRSLFKAINPEMDKKDKGFLWTNLSKMDSGEAYKVQKAESRQYPDFAILKEEIKILKPDVVVFLIGNDYNAQMEEYLKVKIDLIDPTLNISYVTDPEGILPEHSYKIFHPRYLYKLRTHHQVVSSLVDWVKGSS